MTGWNMPPGCNVSDIPGNRPEDLAAEALSEELSKVVGPEMDDNLFETLEVWVLKKMGESYKEGYEQGVSDKKMAREIEPLTAYIERAPRSRGYPGWFVRYNLQDGYAIGEFHRPTEHGTKFRRFRVKIDAKGRFRVEIGNSGRKISFEH